MTKIIAALTLGLLISTSAFSATLLEPQLKLMASTVGKQRVALTFDACTGKVDDRILQSLIDNKISATIFVTTRWLKRNAAAMAAINAHTELFEVENHGAKHLAPVEVPISVYGIKAAGSAAALTEEIASGASAVKAATGHEPTWYRGATGRYTAASEKLIIAMHFKIAGYSLLGDGGAGFSQKKAASVIASAKDGDVIIAHINQPTKPAGAGVVEGILKLKAAGFEFVKLNDVIEAPERVSIRR